MSVTDAYVEQQRRYWTACDEDHYQFQTGAPHFATTEAQLLAPLQLAPGERLLEIGCGEGANLFHIGQRCPQAVLVGVDFSRTKVAAARRHLARAGLRCALAPGDAADLPFADQRFDAVLIRDLLHHLPDRGAALQEARRVLRPGGRLLLIEPNGRAPLVQLQAALVREERGVRCSSAALLREEIAQAGLTLLRIEPTQPLPLSRVLMHPRLGLPRLGVSRLGARALGLVRAVEEVGERLVPRGAWLYLRCLAERPRG